MDRNRIPTDYPSAYKAGEAVAYMIIGVVVFFACVGCLATTDFVLSYFVSVIK